MKTAQPEEHNGDSVASNWTRMELNDDDILDAMRHIPGYLDITTEDFRSIYKLAHSHAQVRFFDGVTADRLMRQSIPSLRPDDTFEGAAKVLADSGYKGLPVVDAEGYVIGMLTETDFLRRLRAANFFDLLLRMMEKSFELAQDCHETLVSEAMTRPAVTVNAASGFQEIIEAFSRHGGRSMPVVAPDGKLRGLLLWKDVLSVYKDRILP
ncbi:MAG: CBS domain-containing protein [Gallionella sp.]